ncbi:MAG: hypothetical protein WC718_19250 [Phycisphaerales bacterium]|jgi:hypothetical protein
MPLPRSKAEFEAMIASLRVLAMAHHESTFSDFETAAFCACGAASGGPAGTDACRAIADLDALAAALKFTTHKTRRKHQWDQIGESLWECRVCKFEGAGYGPGASEWADGHCPGKEER